MPPSIAYKVAERDKTDQTHVSQAISPEEFGATPAAEPALGTVKSGGWRIDLWPAPSI